MESRQRCCDKLERPCRRVKLKSAHAVRFKHSIYIYKHGRNPCANPGFEQVLSCIAIELSLLRQTGIGQHYRILYTSFRFIYSTRFLIYPGVDIFFFLWKIRIIPRGIKENASKKKTSSDILLFLDNRLFRRYYKLAGSPLTSYSVSYQVKSFYKDRFRHFFRIFSKTIKKENRETKELAII